MKYLNKYMGRIICLLGLVMIVVACEPPEVGFISDDIRAVEDTVEVDRGVFATSAPPNVEDSTYPMEWELTGVKNKQGDPTDALFEKHEIVTWTESFNPETDTTVALAQEKIELSEEPSMMINKRSGELIFTQATKFVEKDVFTVSANVSNVKGTKELEDFVAVKLNEFKPVEFPTTMRSRIQFGLGDGDFDNGYTSSVSGVQQDEVQQILDGTHPYFSIQKVSDNPSPGIDVEMVITDSNDQPLDPSEVVFYPSGSSYLQNYHDNSVETVETDEETIFSLPAPPFPQYARNYSGSNSYLMYYLSTKEAFEVDTTAYENDHGETDWTQYKNSQGEVRNRAYIRWGIKINSPGTWRIKMRIPYTNLSQ